MTQENIKKPFQLRKLGFVSPVKHKRQGRLLEAIEKGEGRINLSWGSNLLVQVAAGYADMAIEFMKGFVAYDMPAGVYIADKARLTVLDLDGSPLSGQIDVDAVFDAFENDSKKLPRQAFVAAKNPELAREVLRLLDV